MHFGYLHVLGMYVPRCVFSNSLPFSPSLPPQTQKYRYRIASLLVGLSSPLLLDLKKKLSASTSPNGTTVKVSSTVLHRFPTLAGASLPSSLTFMTMGPFCSILAYLPIVPFHGPRKPASDETLLWNQTTFDKTNVADSTRKATLRSCFGNT